MASWLKWVLRILAGLIVLIIILLVGVTLYINTHKARVVALINTELNKNLDGSLAIGDLSPSFFRSFPGVSLTLKNVLIRDRKWTQHHHTLLDAKDFDVSVNTAALLRGTISINHIDINDAAIDLYTDTSGYSNTSVFKKSKDNKPKDPKDKSSTSAELGHFNLKNVKLTINNEHAKKLFKFDVNELRGGMNFPDSGWNAKVHMKVMARSLAFKLEHGSFIKDKLVEGDLVAGYNETSKKISVKSGNLGIGGDPFTLSALFTPANNSMNFAFHLTANQILWRSASSLVSANITKTLYKFNLDKPIDITAKIEGNFGGGDPLLYITATVKNNTLTIPGAVINNCNFNGVFTNNYIKGKELGDENSIINLVKFTGSYSHLPFVFDTLNIINLVKPIAVGAFKSSFPLTNLNYMFAKVARFDAGTGSMNMRFKADIIDLRLNKPFIAGDVIVKNAGVTYLPKNLNIKNTSVSLHFVQGTLIMDNIRIQSGKSVVTMSGRANNLMNLYYNEPEKILVNWEINSPQIHLGEFLGFLNRRKTTPVKGSSNSNNGNLVDKITNVINKSHVDLHMQVANVFYNKFLATNAKANLLLSEDGIEIKDIGLKTAGGTLAIRGRIVQDYTSNRFDVSTVINHVSIHDFFYAFDNFGLTAPTYQNLKGLLSAKAQLAGTFNGHGGILSKSLNGMVVLNLKNGALVNFNPLKTAGKIAFPFRNLNNIEIPNLDANFDIKGDMVTIKPMQITSSVINADVAGVYGINRGTDIALDIPLRNPKNDTTITDKEELKKKRYKGIVLHLAAKDDGTGKVKIGFNKDRKKD
ncbi:AsmA family protein [Mucilaginibacter polytrichastri]|nr:AsmA family protein [Mucilaginibacter polytrichastri]SFS47168.1 AsmA family protein [Mucilaginibacter polytrichastri]